MQKKMVGKSAGEPVGKVERSYVSGCLGCLQFAPSGESIVPRVPPSCEGWVCDKRSQEMEQGRRQVKSAAW